MLSFYIVDKKNIDFNLPNLPRLAIQDGCLFSFYRDGKTCFVSNKWLDGATGSFVETEDYNFCVIEEPVLYA
jgi:hypothetical protein